MNITENLQTSLSALSPKPLKKCMLMMLVITLEHAIVYDGDARLTKEFFSQLQILFNLLDELQQIQIDAKRTKE